MLDDAYWDSIIEQLGGSIESAADNYNQARRVSDTDPDQLETLRNLWSAEVNRQNRVRDLRNSANQGQAGWDGAMGGMVDNNLATALDGINTSATAAQGQATAAQGNRGLLGSSGDKAMREQIQDTRILNEQAANAAGGAAKKAGNADRDAQINGLVQSLLATDASSVNSVAPSLLQGMENAGDANAIGAQLDRGLQDANSQMWGGIFNNVGQFGAAGFQHANNSNRSNQNWNWANPGSTQRSTDSQWW